MSISLDGIRDYFPALKTQVHGKPLVYLDSAATTLKPASMVTKIDDYYLKYTANIHRGIHYLSEKGTREYEYTRDLAQTFINAKYREEVIFTKGTTESINLVAQSFGSLLNDGDEIIISELEHHSNIVPWQLLQTRKKIILKVIPVNMAGELDLEIYRTLLTSKTKLVAVNHISNALGTINPISEIIELAHQHGAKVLIDGAQAVAHTKIDVVALDADFYVFSLHKLFGPTGVGILYGKKELLEAMPPFLGGGDMIDQVSFERTTFNDLPFKFEAGTPNISGVIAAASSFEFMRELNYLEINQHEQALLKYGTELLSQIKPLKIIGTAKNKTSVISFTIDGIHPHDIASYTDHQGIAIRTGHHCTQPLLRKLGVAATARASMSIYNTTQELDYLAESLNKLISIHL
jgi:cysteine desulfurase/selenocysteine lyase